MKKRDLLGADGNKKERVSPPGIELEYVPRFSFQYVPRFAYDEYDYIGKGYVGNDTPDELLFPAVNLLECLYDTKYAFPAKQYKLFQVIKDCGVRELSCGNHSGGRFEGDYRSFLIAYKGGEKVVSFGFSSYYTQKSPAQTSLNVGFGEGKAFHHALQYVIDKHMGVLLDKATFYHDGRIAIGTNGSGKVSELKAFVGKSYPDILLNNRFCLGSLTYDRQWNLDDPEVMSVIENFISYALIRDDYREYRKKEYEKRLKENG